MVLVVVSTHPGWLHNVDWVVVQVGTRAIKLTGCWTEWRCLSYHRPDCFSSLAFWNATALQGLLLLTLKLDKGFGAVWIRMQGWKPTVLIVWWHEQVGGNKYGRARRRTYSQLPSQFQERRNSQQRGAARVLYLLDKPPHRHGCHAKYPLVSFVCIVFFLKKSIQTVVLYFGWKQWADERTLTTCATWLNFWRPTFCVRFFKASYACRHTSPHDFLGTQVWQTNSFLI